MNEVQKISQGVFSKLQESRALGDRCVTSDFVFEPNLRDLRWRWLIHAAETPVLDGPQVCVIHVTETVLGEGRQLVRAMQQAGEFDATMFEDGDEQRHSVARSIRCKFISVAPGRRDWERRSEIACYEVSLEMTVVSEVDGILRDRQHIAEVAALETKAA